MGFGRLVARFVMFSGLLALLIPSAAQAQVQTSAQQGCITTMNKSGAKVAQTQGKENSACVKDAGLGKLPPGMDADECLRADRKGKVAKATGKTDDGEAKKCTEAPSFGFTGSAVVNAVAVAQEVELASDVFGGSVDNAISSDSVEAKCQASVAKSYEKYAATVLKEFNSCKKTGLKDGSIASPAGLAACSGSDAKGKISGALTKLSDTITKSCSGVALGSVFPGTCAGQAGSAATLGACIANAADCRTCIALREMDALVGTDFTSLVNCDESDDGTVNGSCEGCGNGILEAHESCDDGPGNSDVTPDACRTNCAISHCGDGVVDYADECDDGNNVDGDGCSATCECEPGNPSPKCQDLACPTSGKLVLWAATTGIACTDNNDCAIGQCNVGLGVCTTSTALDTGFTGIAHNSDINDQVVTRGNLICSGPFAGGGEPCGECLVTGIDPADGYCRCANDNRTQCDEPFSLDGDDCGGELCNCYFGPPLPLSSGNTPACVVNRFAVDVTGTANVDTGEGEISARLASVVYLGVNVLAPCPVCGGTCTAPAGNAGNPCGVDLDCDTALGSGDGVCANFDPTAADGVRGGTCFFGANEGESCDVDAYNETFPADPIAGSGGAGLSLDCAPDPGKNVSGSGLKITLDTTTGSVALPPASITCGFDAAPELCPCGVCSQDSAVTCTSNADCTGLGVCGKVGNAPRQNTCPTDGICNDIGGGKGECNQGSISFCDGITRADGTGFIQCNNNADCAAYGPVTGSCSLSSPQACFLDPITATGVPDPNTPVAVAAFCIPPTGNGGINTVAGLPGPARVTNTAQAESYCASNPAVAYTPGVGNCPP
jgi:cysteine-rich repeat protein